MGELQELLKKIKDESVKLAEELNGKKGKNGEPDVPSLEKQKQELYKNLTSSKTLGIKETRKIQKIEARIQEIKDLLEKIKALNSLILAIKSLNSLATGKKEDGTDLTKDEKQKVIKRLTEILEKNCNGDIEPVADALGKEAENVDAKKEKADLEAEIAELKNDIKVLEKRSTFGFDLKKLKFELESKQETLKLIEDYLATVIDKKELESDLKKLSAAKTKKADKQRILDKYTKLLEETQKNLAEEIIAKLEKNNKKKKTKEESKEKSSKLGEWIKKNGKTVGGIIGSLAVVGALVTLLAKGCEDQKTNTNNKPDDTKDNSITSTEENESRNQVDALINKGYNEYYATMMVENFSDELINELSNTSYIPNVENYATVKGFNLNYLNDYENARTIYSITAEDAVDYVNRAHKIQETNFYDEASINDIVEIVIAIDNKDLHTSNNANLAQSFNTSFNRIVDNALFGATTDEDLAKLEALTYFAKEGTDMEQFLSGFNPLCRKVLENPEDIESKQAMYDYLYIFATSLNGFTNESEALNSKEEINEKAQVLDYYDWYVIYNSFIAPMYPTFVPIPTEEVNEEIDKMIVAYEELQLLMISGLEGPEFETLCGQSLTKEN